MNKKANLNFFRTHFSISFLQELKPFFGLVLIIASMLIVVFFKMEERRLGYQVLKLTHEHRVAIELKREKTVILAKILRPQRIEQIAQDQFTLKRITKNQIIQLPAAISLVQDTSFEQQEHVKQINPTLLPEQFLRSDKTENSVSFQLSKGVLIKPKDQKKQIGSLN